LAELARIEAEEQEKERQKAIAEEKRLKKEEKQRLKQIQKAEEEKKRLEAELKKREEEERIKKEREERKRLQELRKKEEKEKRREQRRREAEERKKEDEARKQLERQELEEKQRVEEERKREEELTRKEKQKKAEARLSIERAKKQQEQIALVRQRSMEMEMSRAPKDRKAKEVCVADKTSYSPRPFEFQQSSPRAEPSQFFGDDYFNKNPIMKERSPLFQKPSPMDSYMESNDMTSSVRAFFQNVATSTNGLDSLGISFPQDRSPPVPKVETSKLGVPLQPLDAKAEINNLFSQRKDYDPAREAFNRVGNNSKWNGMPIGFDPNLSRDTYEETAKVAGMTEDFRGMRMKDSPSPGHHDPWVIPPGFNSKNLSRFEPVAAAPPGFGTNRMDVSNHGGSMGGFPNGHAAYQPTSQYGFGGNSMGGYNSPSFPSQQSYGQQAFSGSVPDQSYANANNSGYGNTTPPGFGRAMNNSAMFNPQLQTNMNNGFNVNNGQSGYVMNTARGAVPSPTAWNEMAWNDPNRLASGPPGASRTQEFTFR
jgi:hypothetical protein